MRRSIYLIVNEDTGHVKIGIGKNPANRLQQLQTGNSAKLILAYSREIYHASKVERNLHSFYQEHRLTGEWFDLPIDIFPEIDKKITLYESNFIALQDSPFI